jgi:hypothetical protein
MKLYFGQATTPVPWPIQSSPIASAISPTVRSSLRISFPPAAGICCAALCPALFNRFKPSVALNRGQGHRGGSSHARAHKTQAPS